MNAMNKIISTVLVIFALVMLIPSVAGSLMFISNPQSLSDDGIAMLNNSYYAGIAGLILLVATYILSKRGDKRIRLLPEGFSGTCAFTVQYSLGMYFRAAIESRWRYVVLEVLIMLVCIVYTNPQLSAGSETLHYLLLFLLPVFLFVEVLRVIIPFYRVKYISTPLSIFISPEVIHLVNDIIDTKYQWPIVQRAVESRNFFFLDLGWNKTIAWPKADFGSEENIKTFRTILRSKPCGKKLYEDSPSWSKLET